MNAWRELMDAGCTGSIGLVPVLSGYTSVVAHNHSGVGRGGGECLGWSLPCFTALEGHQYPRAGNPLSP